MFHLLRTLVRQSSFTQTACRTKGRRPARPATARLLLQVLEDRAVPSASPAFDHVYHATDGASLTQAVQTANGQSGTSEIILDRAGNYNLSAALPISGNITITGRTANRASSYIIQPADGVQDRVFNVTGTAAFSLQDVTVQGGTASADGGGIEAQATGASVTLNNVVVRNNMAGNDGGGVYIGDGASLTIRNSVFTNNIAGDSGGGVYFAAASQAGTVSVSGSTFKRNMAGQSNSQGDGGGMDIEAQVPSGSSTGTQPAQVTFTLSRGTFSNNSSSNEGGGVWCIDVATVNANGMIAVDNTCSQDAGALGDSVKNYSGNVSFTFTHGIIIGNRETGPGSGSAPDAGGVCFDVQTSGATSTVMADITGNSFLDNMASGAGGGLFVRDESALTTFNATVSGNFFEGNHTVFSTVNSEGDNGDGGGAYIAASAALNTVTMDRDIFLDNRTTLDGGGLYLRLDSGTANITNSSFRDNHADDGGGMYLTGQPGGTVSLSGDTVQYNSASTDGGGVVNKGETVKVTNSRITHNTAPTDANFSGPFTQTTKSKRSG